MLLRPAAGATVKLALIAGRGDVGAGEDSDAEDNNQVFQLATASRPDNQTIASSRWMMSRSCLRPRLPGATKLFLRGRMQTCSELYHREIHIAQKDKSISEQEAALVEREMAVERNLQVMEDNLKATENMLSRTQVQSFLMFQHFVSSLNYYCKFAIHVVHDAYAVCLLLMSPV
ncbi:hypothetical protein EJB05_12508, partial [Eragrostis curvula]